MPSNLTASNSGGGSGGSRVSFRREYFKAYDAPFPSEALKQGMRQFPILIPITRNDPGAAINRRTFEALRKFERPFLTLFGDSDPSTRGWETIFQQAIPGAKGQPHAILKGAGHFLPGRLRRRGRGEDRRFHFRELSGSREESSKAWAKEILDILLPIYACAGLGFALGRFGVAWDAKTISPLVLQVAFPLLVIHQFTRPGCDWRTAWPG